MKTLSPFLLLPWALLLQIRTAGELPGDAPAAKQEDDEEAEGGAERPVQTPGQQRSSDHGCECFTALQTTLKWEDFTGNWIKRNLLLILKQQLLKHSVENVSNIFPKIWETFKMKHQEILVVEFILRWDGIVQSAGITECECRGFFIKLSSSLNLLVSFVLILNPEMKV